MRFTLAVCLLVLAGACASGGGGDPRAAPLCTPDAYRCEDGGTGVFERCTVEGDWIRMGQCSGACGDGRCGDAECPDEQRLRCFSDNQWQRCVARAGGWTFPEACDEGETCEAGVCRVSLCTANALFCDGSSVRVCNTFGTGSISVEDCGEGMVCRSGACADACDLASADSSFIGCEYFSLDADNSGFNPPYDDDGSQYDIIVANTDSDSVAVVTVDIKNDKGEWELLREAEVESQGIKIIPAACTDTGACGSNPCALSNAGPDRHVEDTALAPGGAFRIRSDRPIVAYQLTSDDRNGCASSSGSTILLPTNVLGKEHYAMTMPQNPGPDALEDVEEPDDMRGWVSVVATQDGTDVAVRVSAATIAGPGVPALSPAEKFDAVLDEGDVLQISSAENGDDLSGTKVVSSAPVAVFAGHECLNVDGEPCLFFSGGGDHVEEQMLPVEAWGTNFVAGRARHPQQGATSRSIFRVIVSEDDTEIDFDTDNNVNLPAHWVMQAGEVRSIEVSGNNGTAEHFTISASGPSMVVQFTEDEPVAITVVPTEQYLSSYLFMAPPFFDDSLTITRFSEVPVELDGTPVPSVWQDAANGFEVVTLNNFSDGSHVIEAPDKLGTIGVQVVGMDENCSYGYLGGLDVEPINVD